VHPLVRQVVDTYLGLVTGVPIEGLYLVGSVALDDFRPHASDIDFVAVTREPLTDKEIAALTRVHTALRRRWLHVDRRRPHVDRRRPHVDRRRPHFDGGYVTWQDLAGDPSRAGTGADAHEGRLTRRAAGRGDPIAWHTLAGHGVRVRGPRVADVDVWTDRAVLSAWTHRNLDEYWRVWLTRSSRLLSPHGLACVIPRGPVWGVLGVSRLHYTLATGGITSKRGAGEYARDAFDRRWRRIVDECLRLRAAATGSARYRNPFTRRRDALDFVAMAIEDAHRLV